MSDIECPNCGHTHDIDKHELYEIYDEDGKETELDCVKCGKPLIITSTVDSWTFDVIVNE